MNLDSHWKFGIVVFIRLSSLPAELGCAMDVGVGLCWQCVLCCVVLCLFDAVAAVASLPQSTKNDADANL